MKIQLNLYATLARYLPAGTANGGWVDVAAGTTINGLLQQLGIPEASVKLIFINGTHAGGDSVRDEGGRVGVFPPVGGG